MIKKKLNFEIKEITKDSKNTIFCYTGSREKLKNPIKYKFPGKKEIVFAYKNIVKATGHKES